MTSRFRDLTSGVQLILLTAPILALSLSSIYFYWFSFRVELFPNSIYTFQDYVDKSVDFIFPLTVFYALPMLAGHLSINSRDRSDTSNETGLLPDKEAAKFGEKLRRAVRNNVDKLVETTMILLFGLGIVFFPKNLWPLLMVPVAIFAGSQIIRIVFPVGRASPLGLVFSQHFWIVWNSTTSFFLVIAVPALIAERDLSQAWRLAESREHPVILENLSSGWVLIADKELQFLDKERNVLSRNNSFERNSRSYYCKLGGTIFCGRSNPQL
jgi:hypothetical protein